MTDVLELDVIDSRTVFVLGAGASNPFGLPLGTGLRRFVLENFNDKQGHAVHLYNTTGFTEQQVEKFISALRFSGRFALNGATDPASTSAYNNSPCDRDRIRARRCG